MADYSGSGDVAIGARDFLFHRYELAFEQVCGGALPDDRQLARWQSVLESRHAWCAARGIAYATLVIPERHVIYDDCLPGGATVSKNRGALRLRRVLGSVGAASFLYPEEDLRRGRAEGDVYFKTDEHVNPRGAYICYRALLDLLKPVLGLEPLDPDDYTVSTYEFTGNLGMRLESEPAELAEVWHVPKLGGSARIFKSPPGDGRVEVFQHERNDLPKAIFLGDSNLFSLWHFLVPHFSRLILLHDNGRMFHDLIRREKPDLVVHVMSEMSIGNVTEKQFAIVPIDSDVHDFRDFCRTDLPEPEADEQLLLVVDFGMPETVGAYLREGWSFPEQGHCWMEGALSRLACPPVDLAPGVDHLRVEIDVFPHAIPGEAALQRLHLSCAAGGEAVALGAREVRDTGWLSWTIGASSLGDVAGRELILTFEHPDGFSPESAGLSADPRVLSCAVQRLAIWAVG